MATIYYGGTIITMEGENDRPEALLEDRGMIRFVGSIAEAKAAAPGARLVDLGGRCLMPGFIDPHSHITMNGQMALFADLSTCRSFDDIVEAMRAYIAENRITEKQVAVGFGYDHNFLREQAHPGKVVLDRVSKTVPVGILHVSAHMGCGNSALLALAGVDENTPDPQGGRYGRVAGTNEPDGYFEEAATLALQGCMKKVKLSLRKMLDGMQKTYVEHGVTTAQDGATNKSGLLMLKAADLLGRLDIDVVAYPQLPAGAGLFAKNAKRAGCYRGHLKLGGYKIILDGSPQGRSAWMSRPYLGGAPDYCGYPWLENAEVLEHCRRAIREGRQILAHCNGDAASQQFLDAYEQALGESGSTADLRPVMIHCQTARSDQLERMVRLKMIPSIFVGHIYFWGDVHLRNFGPERGGRISPAGEALRLGLPINFHQDTPVTRPNMLHSVWAAVCRQTREGRTLDENQKTGVYDALKAITINAAYQYFEEDSKGSLKAGKRADLVILDRSPLAVEPMELKNIRVVETIKDGKCIYRVQNAGTD